MGLIQSKIPLCSSSYKAILEIVNEEFVVICMCCHFLIVHGENVVGHLMPSYFSKSRVLNLGGIIRPCTRLNSDASIPPLIFIPSTTLNLSFRSSYFSSVSISPFLSDH